MVSLIIPLISPSGKDTPCPLTCLIILDRHLHTCVTTAMRSDDPQERERVIDEIMKVFNAKGKS